MQRIATDGKQRTGRSVRLGKWWMAAAAACIAAVVMFAVRFNAPGQSESAALEDEALFLETSPELMDLSSQALAEMEATEETDDISQEAIIEYLAYNGLSGAYLYEQLAEAE